VDVRYRLYLFNFQWPLVVSRYVDDVYSVFVVYTYLLTSVVVSFCSLYFFCVCVYLQVISLAGWVNIMYFIQDAHSFWDWTYFVSLIIVSTSSLSMS